MILFYKTVNELKMKINLIFVRSIVFKETKKITSAELV